MKVAMQSPFAQVLTHRSRNGDWHLLFTGLYIRNPQMSHMDLSFPMVIFNVSYFEIKKMTISPNSLCNECSGSYPQLICPISCNYVSSMILGSNFMSGTTLTRHTWCPIPHWNLHPKCPIWNNLWDQTFFMSHINFSVCITSKMRSELPPKCLITRLMSHSRISGHLIMTGPQITCVIRHLTLSIMYLFDIHLRFVLIN